MICHMCFISSDIYVHMIGKHIDCYLNMPEPTTKTIAMQTNIYRRGQAMGFRNVMCNHTQARVFLKQWAQALGGPCIITDAEVAVPK